MGDGALLRGHRFSVAAPVADGSGDRFSDVGYPGCCLSSLLLRKHANGFRSAVSDTSLMAATVFGSLSNPKFSAASADGG